MHHCFIAHSFITYLVGRLIAHSLSIPRPDQTIICTRGFQPNPSDADISVQLAFAREGEDFPTFRKFYKGRKRLAALDDRFRILTGGRDFKLYTFDTSTRYNQLIYSMLNCRAVAVLEEGLASYSDVRLLGRLFRWPVTRQQRWLNWLNYGHRVQSRGFLEPGTEVYALFEEAFPGASSKRVVFDRDVIRSVCREQAVAIPNGAVILVHDWNSDTQFQEYAALQIHNLHRNAVTRCYQKFHPFQKEESRHKLTALFEKAGISVETLPPGTALEHYVFSDQQYTFLGFQSSILYYAARMGKPTSSAFDFSWGSLQNDHEEDCRSRGWVH